MLENIGFWAFLFSVYLKIMHFRPFEDVYV
jgi:hypothetical protein